MDSLTPATFRALPDAAPLAMPTQSLHTAPPRSPRPPSSPRAMGLRRLTVIGGAVALTIAGAHEMYLVFAMNGVTALAIFMLALFLALFAWIALSFTSALAGFCSLLAGGGCRLGTGQGAPLPHLMSRTALLMPTYNEQPARIMAGLQAIRESLGETGAAEAFDLFILSDTTDPAIWIAEEAGFLALRERTGGYGSIFYRRRPKNVARKSGNIADWVTRFGGAYVQFLILDADSLMTGETLVRLAGAMERHPDVGLIQTLPIITGATTLFARVQQFAGRVYGPLIAHGIAWWHGAEGNYWGHNAMIRTRAFAEQAGLPELSGRKPFGGPIMSHDFVEAALMRRGAWAVHMVPGVRGSYEEVPPTLTDLAVRDRRWCQGNLQHLAVLPTRGLAAMSRLHLLTGIGSYITAPLWLLFILTGIMIAVQARFVPPDYFPQGKSLFPQWPVIDPVRAMWMFVGTMALLLVPKLLGCVAILLRREERRRWRLARLVGGILYETLVAGLIAPVVMLTQTIDVAAIVLGRDSGWNAQRRDDGVIPARETRRLYRRHTLLGLLLGAVAWAVSLSLALWMLPVVLGLALAIPLALLTGRRRSSGLLRTPEDLEPPPVVARAAALQREWQTEGAPDVAQLLREPRLLAAHMAMLLPPRRPRIDPIDATLVLARAKLEEADTLDAAITALSAAELTAVLADAGSLRRLAALTDAKVTTAAD
ncbi:MAG TPA: glucans biosynthesis glucosyltransferase MdoH [Acetobacteraceae bacterium]|nr:glucans biosynthesis glucosyltransferase MdoH [Acetobacteraceae bacterium]